MKITPTFQADGLETTVTVRSDDRSKLVGIGVSRCRPDDAYSARTGRLLALGRALQSLGSAYEARGLERAGMTSSAASPTSSDARRRYDDLQAKARRVHHEVRVVVKPGVWVSGESLVVRTLLEDSGDLDSAMAAVDAYLSTPEARRRGELSARVDETFSAWLSKAVELRAAERDHQAAVDAEAAFVEALDDEGEPREEAASTEEP